MAKTYSAIKTVSDQIKNATTAASNTAAIVGGNLGDIVDKIQEVDGAKVPTERTVNGKPLSGDIILNAADIGIAADLADKVSKTATETIGGTKTFSDSPIVPTPTADMQAATKKYVDDSTVGISGNETISGVKTFQSSPIVPAPTTDMQAATKKYVDDSTVGISGNETITGIKTFQSSPIVPTPTTDTQATTKKYVDDEDASLRADLNETNKSIGFPRLKSAVVGGNMEDSIYANYTISPTNRKLITDERLNNVGLKTISYNNAGVGSNVELYMYAYSGFGVDKGLGNKFSNNNGNYCKATWYLYSKFGAAPVKRFGNRLGVIAKADSTVTWVGSGVLGAEEIDVIKISETVFRVEKIFKITFTGNLNYVQFSTVWEAAELSTEFVKGDVGITGLSVAFSINKIELQTNVIDDWYQPISAEEVNSTISGSIQQNIYLNQYNNFHGNITKISEFLRKHEMKEVDEYNQLTITMPGDSIFGRVDKSSFTEVTAEVSLTPDCNGGTGYGYVTGHFPPNMWEQIVGYKVLEMLQFPHSDVKYYNHVASEVTKFGTWTNIYPAGSDCLRLVRGAALNDYIQLTFTGASFVKFIYSNYLGTGKTRKLILTISDDGGNTFKKISDAGLSSSLTLDSNSGLSLPNQDYKWGNIIISGLDKSKLYIFRVQKNDGYNLDIWGFETWSNPRINVVITAEGGNTAINQLTRWDRFYSKMYNPALIIYELPYLNDLGTGQIKNYKGIATSATAPSASPTLYDFWYASESGAYANFGGLEAISGDYIEWDGTAWKLGSATLDTSFATYKNANENVFKRLMSLGCPVLSLITHTSGNWIGSRPYIYNNGLSILRNLVSMYGLASIDINFYQMNYGYIEGIYSDGTHLNDAGVELYRKLIAELLDIPHANRFVGVSSPVSYREYTGVGNGAGTISFGFEFARTPIIRTYNNSSIIVTNITQSGFTVTGTGAYDWEAFVE